MWQNSATLEQTCDRFFVPFDVGGQEDDGKVHFCAIFHHLSRQRTARKWWKSKWFSRDSKFWKYRQKRPINGGSCPWRGSLKCGACPALALRSVLCVSTYDVEGGPGWQHGGGLGHTAIYYNNACHLIFLYTHLLFNIFRRNVCDPIFNNVYGCFVNRCHKSSVNCEVISALVRVKCDTEPIH